MNPVIKNKGSAIFMHIAKKNYSKTLGCIGLKKNDLLEILSKVKSKYIMKDEKTGIKRAQYHFRASGNFFSSFII
jgi:hypothetical protein